MIACLIIFEYFRCFEILLSAGAEATSTTTGAEPGSTATGTEAGSTTTGMKTGSIENFFM